MNAPPTLAACDFEKALTEATLVFDILVLVGCGLALYYLRRLAPRFWLRFPIMLTGVLIFEIFTGPMWLNEHLGRFAYVYSDVSWILSLGWTTLFLGTVLLVDAWKPEWKAGRRFGLYLIVLLPLVVLAEIAVVQLDIRSYSQEVLDATMGLTILGVPIEVLYYVPVFASLVITFYKYWSFVIDRVPLVPVRRRRWARGIGLAIVAVLLFELMIEPMAVNKGFPGWSYIYRDISILMSGLWIAVIGIGAVVVDRHFLHKPLIARFFIAIGVMSTIALAIESWLIKGGFRVYGPAAVANFSGHTTPVTGIAVEVAFAIPFYLALMVCFVRFWEIVSDNRN